MKRRETIARTRGFPFWSFRRVCQSVFYSECTVGGPFIVILLLRSVGAYELVRVTDRNRLFPREKKKKTLKTIPTGTVVAYCRLFSFVVETEPFDRSSFYREFRFFFFIFKKNNAREIIRTHTTRVYIELRPNVGRSKVKNRFHDMLSLYR